MHKINTGWYMRLERTLFICLHPFTKTHIHLNDITYHIDQQKEPREGHSHRPSSEMVPSTYRRLSRQSLPQGSAYKGSQVSRCPPWEPGTCVRMAIRAPASLPPPHHKAQAACGHLMLPPNQPQLPLQHAQEGEETRGGGGGT